MKKIYEKPIIEVIEHVCFENILANSEPEVTENIGAKENMFDIDEDENENVMLYKSKLWD